MQARVMAQTAYALRITMYALYENMYWQLLAQHNVEAER